VEAIGSNVRTGQSLAVVMGAGGMAMAVARRLGNTHRVMIVDRDGDHLDRQVAVLRAEGLDAAGVRADITDPGDVRRVAGAARDAGPVKALAHVVGLAPATGDAPSIMRVNLRGAALVAEEFSAILPPGSAAVFVASLAAHLGEAPAAVIPVVDEPLAPELIERVTAAVPGFGPTEAYQLSKVGLLRMVQRLAGPWGARSVRIVSLSPGLIATPMGAAGFESPAKRALYELTPLRREGTMVEIADAIEFLLSERASFITGVDLLVDGGVAAAARHASSAA